MKDKIMGTKKWFFYVSIGIVLILVYKFLDNFTGIGIWIGKLLGVLAPFLSAVLIAYILFPPCRKIEKYIKNKTKIKHARGISIIIVYVIVAVIMYLILKFIIPIMFSSILDLVNNAQSYYNSITTNEMNESFAPFIKDKILGPAVEFIGKINFEEMFTIEKIIGYINSVAGVFRFIVNLFIAMICSIYILAEREKILGFMNKLAKATMPAKTYKHFRRYFTNGNTIFFRFISSQLIDAFVVAIIMSVALSIMKIKYGIALGAMVGIFNLIPYFGAIAAVIIAGLITILTGGWEQAIIMVIVMIILQQVDANIINPRITSTSLNVSPLLVIFAVTVGGAYFGIIGMFLGIPVAVLIKYILEDYIKNKQKI